MGESLGEEKPEPKASKPDAVASQAKKPAPKAKPARALPPRKALALAHAAGVSAATGAPCAPTTDRWQLDALEAACAAHGAGQVGAALLGWLTGEAKSFALAKSGDVFTAGNGFAPKLFGSWLNGGRPGAPRPAAPPGPPQPRPGPIDRGPRSVPTGPPAVIPEGAGAVEIVAPKQRTVAELEAAIRDEVERQTPRPPRRPSAAVVPPASPEEVAARRARITADLQRFAADHPEAAQ